MANKNFKRQLSVAKILKTAVAVQARNLKGVCRLCRSQHNRRVSCLQAWLKDHRGE
jgi:hypothetical protein